MDSHAALFLAALPAGIRGRLAAFPALEGHLAAIVEKARRKWPRFELTPATFLSYVAERIAKEVDPEAALVALHAEDLYLACGCASGNAVALAAFVTTYFPDIDVMVAPMGDAQLDDEVKQVTSQKLLVASAGAPPRIADYAGRGDLRTWFRLVAARVAANLLRGRGKERPLEAEAIEALPCASADPDLVLLWRRHEADFKAAFAEAVKRLTARERNVLHQHLTLGLTIDEIGAMYHVHRTTAYRWVAKAREHVWARTRADLSRRLRLSPSELYSLIEDVRSRLDLSIERALQAPEAP